MHQWIVPPADNMIEMFAAPTIYCSGPPAIEWLGDGNVCAYMTQNQLPIEARGQRPQAVVQVKLIRPAGELPRMALTISECIYWHHCLLTGRKPPPPPTHFPGGPLRVVS